MGKLYTISQGSCFLKVLADFCVSHKSATIGSSSNWYVILPTNRSILGLMDALRQYECKSKKTIVLPKFYAIADLAKNPWAIPQMRDIPSVMTSLERLTYVINMLPETFSTQKRLRFGTYLCDLHDQCVIAEVPLLDLKLLFTNDRASSLPEHVLEASQYLKIITDDLEDILHKQKKITAAQHTILATQYTTQYLKDKFDFEKLVIAGTTGTVPSTRRMVQMVHQHPKGIVVLPGLDVNSLKEPMASRIKKMPTHPQYTLLDLCSSLDVGGDSVDSITILQDDSKLVQKRSALITSLFQEPPLSLVDDQNNDSPKLISCDSLHEEARIISLIVKKHLLTSDDSIAIVTPQQALMERLNDEFKRLGIMANQSAGEPLLKTPVGSFIRALANFYKAPSRLTCIHLAKHPLTFKNNRVNHLQFVRNFEIYIRSKQTTWFVDEDMSFLDIKDDVSSTRLRGDKTASDAQNDAVSYPDDFIKTVTYYYDKIKDVRSFFEYVKIFKESALSLTHHTLFEKEDGKSAHDFFNSMSIYHMNITSAFDEALILLMEMAPPVHSPLAIGSRVRVLGTLEARLNTASCVICSGLNEGNWPKMPEADPYLSDGLRVMLGLPSQKRQQGLAAHDFCTSFYAKHLYFTRSQSQNGELQIPSRLWVRMEMLLGAQQDHEDILKRISSYRKLSMAYSINPPMPAPAVDLRPHVFFASHIEQLISNPYGYYVRHVLKLMQILPLQESLTARDKGQLIHSILDGYLKKIDDPALDKLLVYAEPFFDTSAGSVAYQVGIKQTFWWHRFKRIASWWHDKLDNEPVVFRDTELKGSATLKGKKDSYVISSRADRLEVARGSKSCDDFKEYVRIIDYKTGRLPTRKNIQNGKSSQLLVESMIAKNEGFGEQFTSDHSYVCEYWSLTGGVPAADTLVFTLTNQDIQAHQQALVGVLDYYCSSISPYLANPNFFDEEIFSRLEEWEMLI